MTVLVSIDEPPAGTNDRFGGTAAAPVFAELAPTIIHELGIMPSPGTADCPTVVSHRCRTPHRHRRWTPPAWAGCAPSSSRASSSSRWRTIPAVSCRGRCSPASAGTTSTATTFADEAVGAGATVLLVDHRLSTLGVAQIVVDDTRPAIGPIAAAVAGHPVAALTTVGITGTNGKTTTDAAPRQRSSTTAGLSDAACVGTLHGTRTTPEATDLQRCSPGSSTDGRSARSSWRCRRMRSRCTASTAPSSTSSCSPTSATITSTCTARWRRTSAPRRAVRSRRSRALGVINVDDTAWPPARRRVGEHIAGRSSAS